MFKNRADASFESVALALIVLGAAILGYGLAGWLVNIFGLTGSMALPSAKVIGGAVIVALGYIHLELELLRKK